MIEFGTISKNVFPVYKSINILYSFSNQNIVFIAKYDDYHNMTALHIACERGYAEIAALLLRHGSHSNDNERCFPPLVCAIAHKRSDCVELLLKHKV